jgi:uncharacterized protein (DUF983 family)
MKSFDDASGSSTTKTSLGTLIGRALWLRCPVCGGGRLFRRGLLMHSRCTNCGLRFEREPGYWLGSIYVNYGLTALIVTFSYFALYFSEALEPTQILWLLTAFCVLFPLWFFRYARAIWMAFDLYFDPAEPDEFKSQNGTAERQQETATED